MVKITTENYKAEMLLTSLRGLSNQKGLGYKNLLDLSRLSAALEVVMKPYLELRRTIISEYSTKDEKTGQSIIAPDKQDEAMKKMEDIAQAEVEMDLTLPLVLNVKDESFLDLNIIKGFVDVLGEDNFKVVTVETPTKPIA